MSALKTMASSTPTPDNNSNKPEPGSVLIVIHNFDARSSDELTLKKGDRVQLVERDDDFGDGWYLGKLVVGGVTGLFPGNYTRPAPKGVPETSSASASVPRSNSSLQTPTIASSSTAGHSPSPFQKVTSTVSPLDSRASAPAPEANHALQNNHHVGDSYISGPPNEVPLKTVTPSAPVPMTPKNLNVALESQMNGPGQDSPVMNETLSVIQEHISDMNSPRHQVAIDRRGPTDSSSEYSSYGHRASYINGEETDEEEDAAKSNGNDVRLWTSDQVADYLHSVGVDPAHCEVFRDQEISGEVLLEMEQSSLLAPIFDLGSIGKRLKIWQKIKTLQQEVMGTPAGTRRNTQTYASEAGSEETGRTSSQGRSKIGRGSTDTVQIHGPMDSQNMSLSRYSQRGIQSNSVQASSPVSPIQTADRSFPVIDSPTRPSAASIRDLHHSRKRSSNDMSGNSTSTTLPVNAGSPTASYSLVLHKKGPSFDKDWTMNNKSPVISGRPASSHSNTTPANADEGDNMRRITPWEFDRGYFSGGETESRPRSFLRKKTASSHSRSSSYIDEQRERTATTSARHSRYGSVDSIPQPHVSSASQKYYGLQSGWRGILSASPAVSSVNPRDVPAPVITNLEGNNSKHIVSSPISQTRQNITNTLQQSNGVLPHKGLALRATSDAVTGSEKARVASPDPTPFPPKDDSLQSPSRTASTASGGPSLELESTTNSKLSNVMSTPSSGKSKRKGKKETSAYVRGLEAKTPQEQMGNCDYSGWMKKRSTNIMATWKPRLFFLRGRRLSYYYSEEDTREKGVIDISYHKVLPADDEIITALHAQITRASPSSSSPSNATSSSKEANTMFIFKLVPPKPGLAHAITFTKPTVHYFAVPNVIQGRLWMAALMKATIERDFNDNPVTTFQAKTITLEAARAQRHRPPALMNVDEQVEEEPMKTPATDLSGLNIRGIIFDNEDKEKDEKDNGMPKLELTHKTKETRQPESAQPYGSFLRSLDTTPENGILKREETPQTA